MSLASSRDIQTIGALALARAGDAVRAAASYALRGDAAKPRAMYQDFLALWKDADQTSPF